MRSHCRPKAQERADHEAERVDRDQASAGPSTATTAASTSAAAPTPISGRAPASDDSDGEDDRQRLDRLDAFLFLTTFLASGVEAVEALTIVLAVGRHPRLALVVDRRRRGGGRAGGDRGGARACARARADRRAAPRRRRLLLVSDCSGCARRSCARAASRRCTTKTQFSPGARAAAATRPRRARGIDWYAFTVAFKGVFLEGLEVAFIVVTFGNTGRHRACCGRRRRSRIVLVLPSGRARARRSSGVPENTIKFAVGLHAHELRRVLGRRGCWCRLARRRPCDPGLLAFLGLLSFALVHQLRHQRVTARTAVGT